HHFLHARNGLDLLFVVAGQIEDQRNLVADDQALRRLFARLVVIKTPPDGDEEGQQQQRAANAENGQDATALVAEGVFGDKTGQGHTRELQERTGTDGPSAKPHQNRRKSQASATSHRQKSQNQSS